MNFSVLITEQAHADIQRNALWWAEHYSVEQAIQWQGTVYRQIDAIANMPESYSLSPENAQLPFQLREQRVGLGRKGYRAVFTIRGTDVLVLAVRRGAQDALRADEITD